ncbi:hypothetical protein [Emcibacter sp. SYSU 3D8]|uniref:hypothetical protein n=1 Tax=Emcibacter sp. SYSU 3D8 TaxID=3133969 RepID=UPI0031FF2931
MTRADGKAARQPMRVDLLELLQKRAVHHPTSITSFEAAGNGLRISVKGYAWWLGNEDYYTSRTMSLVFEEIGEGFVYLPIAFDDRSDEALEDFEVTLLANHAWAHPPIFAIYGNAPLPDPLALHAKVHDYLRTSNASKGASDFLNACDTLAGFVQITSRRSYLAAQGPEAIRQIVCQEMEAQGVSFAVLDQKAYRMAHLLVRLDGAFFTCERAFAEFDED